MSSQQGVIDVSALSTSTADSSGLLWWGNLGMIVIESTMFAMCIGTYFYLRVGNLEWPPPTVQSPLLGLPTVGLVLLLLSVIPMLMADRAALRKNTPMILTGYLVCALIGAAMIWIRAEEISRLDFKWSSHAYGSVIWAMLTLHLFHLATATGELVVLMLYAVTHGIDDDHWLDIRCTAAYWYFVVFWWIPLYALIYVAPHVVSYS